MLGKLLKYDLKYMVRNMSVFYVLTIFFAITTRIFDSVEQSTTMISILKGINTGCFISMLANTFINTMMRSWIRFRDSIYKDEAYLTHTLPVTKNDIYNSKFIQTFVFFIASFVVIIASLFIAYFTEERWAGIKTGLSAITTGFDMNITVFVICFLAVVFLEAFNAIQCGFLGMILGHQQSNNKIAFSVVFGFVAYLVAQSVVLALVFIVGLFNSDIMDLFKNEVMLNGESFRLMITVSIAFYALVIWLMSIACKKLLSRGVNIE